MKRKLFTCIGRSWKAKFGAASGGRGHLEQHCIEFGVFECERFQLSFESRDRLQSPPSLLDRARTGTLAAEAVDTEGPHDVKSGADPTIGPATRRRFENAPVLNRGGGLLEVCGECRFNILNIGEQIDSTNGRRTVRLSERVRLSRDDSFQRPVNLRAAQSDIVSGLRIRHLRAGDSVGRGPAFCTFQCVSQPSVLWLHDGGPSPRGFGLVSLFRRPSRRIIFARIAPVLCQFSLAGRSFGITARLRVRTIDLNVTEVGRWFGELMYWCFKRVGHAAHLIVNPRRNSGKKRAHDKRRTSKIRSRWTRVYRRKNA